MGLMAGTFIAWRGASLIDGAPIRLAVSGAGSRPTQNPKTGPMVQTWIMRDDCHPLDALKDGRDASVCGSCPLRPSLGGGCYVNRVVLGQFRWDMPEESPARVAELADYWQRGIRIGAYGDPGALPLVVVRAMAGARYGYAAYTRRWRERPDLAPYCMASVFSAREAREARDLGFRIYMISEGQPTDRSIRPCPGACWRCMGCSGHLPGGGETSRIAGYWIAPHGNPTVLARAREAIRRVA